MALLHPGLIIYNDDHKREVPFDKIIDLLMSSSFACEPFLKLATDFGTALFRKQGDISQQVLIFTSK